MPGIHANCLCLETHESFRDVAAAARAYNLDREEILKALDTGEAVADRWHFVRGTKHFSTPVYIDPSLKDKEPEAAKRKKVPYPYDPKKAIICLQTGKRYPSFTAAEKDLGLRHGDVKQSVYSGRPISGLHFRFEIDDEYEPLPPRIEYHWKTRKRPRI